MLGAFLGSGCTSLPEQAEVPTPGMAYVDFYGDPANWKCDLWEVFLLESGTEKHFPRANPVRVFSVGLPVLRVPVAPGEVRFTVGTWKENKANEFVYPWRTEVRLTATSGMVIPVSLRQNDPIQKTVLSRDPRDPLGRVIETTSCNYDNVRYTATVGVQMPFVPISKVPYRYADAR